MFLFLCFFVSSVFASITSQLMTEVEAEKRGAFCDALVSLAKHMPGFAESFKKYAYKKDCKNLDADPFHKIFKQLHESLSPFFMGEAMYQKHT